MIVTPTAITVYQKSTFDAELPNQLTTLTENS
jgi:hypothetical protein